MMGPAILVYLKEVNIRLWLLRLCVKVVYLTDSIIRRTSNKWKIEVVGVLGSTYTFLTAIIQHLSIVIQCLFAISQN